MTKIGNGQLVCMSLCLCTFGFFSGTEMYSGGMLRGILLSSALKLIPVVLIILYAGREELQCRFIESCFALFFVVYGAQQLLLLTATAQSVNLLPDSRLLAVAAVAAAGIYCASLGLSANARAAVPAAVFIVIGVAVLVIGGVKQAHLGNIALSGDGGTLCAAVRDLWSSGELALLLYLARRCPRPRRAVLAAFTAGAVLRAGICFLGAAVLGRLSAIGEYPFFLLGAYSQPFSVQRADWLYLALYTVVALMSISIQIMLSAHITRKLFPKLKYTALICAAGIIFLSSAMAMLNVSLYPICGALIILLTVAVPSVCIVKTALSKSSA